MGQKILQIVVVIDGIQWIKSFFIEEAKLLCHGWTELDFS